MPDVTDDVDDLDNSNWPKFFEPFAIAGTDERPFCRCPECGLVQLERLQLAPRHIRTYIRLMGSNSRHGSDVTQAAVNEVTTRPKPIGLTPAEIGDAITEAREPIEVESWVRYPETTVRVSGRAVAWTTRAVWVEFTTHSGATSRVWVYANAVQRR